MKLNVKRIMQGTFWGVRLRKNPGACRTSKADSMGDALQQDQLHHLSLQLCRRRGEREAQSQRVPSLPLLDVN